MYEKHYCWSILHRLFHWMFALSIVVLVVTGFYVNTPWTNTMLEYSQSWPMAWMRYMHFVAGYVFARRSSSGFSSTSSATSRNG